MEHLGTCILRAFQPDDLPAVLAAVGAWARDADFRGYLHPGDVAHAMSNGLRGTGLEQHLALAEDEAGALVGLALIYSARSQGFDVMVAPARRGNDDPLEADLLAWAEAATRTLLPPEATWVGSDVTEGDPRRAELLRRLGFAPEGEPSTWITRRSLASVLPEPRLPAGFAIRSATGEDEAAALGAVHAAAFGSSWPGDAYRAVMRTPGYDAERELVVVAPDGQLAAFLVYWLDPESRCGLFEPVGCAPAFQRRGLTRALMHAGMRRMAASGMSTAMVNHQSPERNAPAAALYASLGFALLAKVTDYRRALG